MCFQLNLKMNKEIIKLNNKNKKTVNFEDKEDISYKIPTRPNSAKIIKNNNLIRLKEENNKKLNFNEENNFFNGNEGSANTSNTTNTTSTLNINPSTHLNHSNLSNLSQPSQTSQGSNNNNNNQGNLKQGKDARVLVPKAQELRNRIIDDDSQSRKLLRNIYTAESALNSISIEEKIVEFYLKTKFDSIIIQEFAKHVLSSTFDSLLKCNGEFDTTIELENILKEEPSSQLNSILDIANNYRELVYDVCTRILDYCEIPLADDTNYPTLCSPNLNMMMSCFRSYLSLHQVSYYYYSEYFITIFFKLTLL